MIGIFIHLYDKDVFHEFGLYYSLIDILFPDNILLFNLTNTEENKLYAKYVIYKRFKNSHVIYSENKGVDIYAFFNQIRYIRENNIKVSWILKIHTKNNTKWRSSLILPLLSINVLKFIKNNLNNDKYGFIASYNHILNKDFDKDFPQNIDGVKNASKIINKIDINYKYFVAGTMFWINHSIIEKIDEDIMKYFEINFYNEKPPDNLNFKEICYEYVFERIITGSLCTKNINIAIKDTKLINVNDYNGILEHIY